MKPFADGIEAPGAGIDVHKRALSVCVIDRGARGQECLEVRDYETPSQSLRAMARWFEELGVTHAALESAANYWRPVFDPLEAVCQVLLLNPQFVRQMPGRKSDTADCIRIGRLLRKGLVRASFITAF